MKLFPLFMFLIFFVTNISWGAELTISVLNPDKTPANNIKVQEVQLARYSRRPRNHLLGVTDEKGELKVRFAEKPDDADNTRVYEFIYRYVVMPEDYRWEISDIYGHTYPAKDTIPSLNRDNENWSIGKKIIIEENTQLKWEVILRKGENITVEVVDQFNEPLKDKQLSIILDLQILSHTGLGGEIPISKVDTDSKGYFMIPNAGDFYYTIGIPNQNQYIAPDINYLSSYLTKKFAKDEANKLVYQKRIGKKMTIIVIDSKTGKPVSDASILEVISYPSAIQGGPMGKTDIHGEYKNKNFYTEHVVKFGVSKEGYKDHWIPMEQFVPDTVYKISLEPESE